MRILSCLWQVFASYRRRQSRGSLHNFSEQRLPWNWCSIRLIVKCLFYGTGVCPLPRPNPAVQYPLPSCLLSWLNIAGSSIRASWSWRGHPPLPLPCLSLSSALELGMTQSQTPKTGASLAGRPGFSRVGGMLGFNGGNRQGDSRERAA